MTGTTVKYELCARFSGLTDGYLAVYFGKVGHNRTGHEGPEGGVEI